MDPPADPVLASDIWLLHSKGHNADFANKKLPTKCHSIDKTLDGGFEYGQIHSITSDAEHGAQELIQALLISHLTSDPTATATIIDSTLSFDVRRLHQALSASLEPDPDISASAKAINILQRLQIMQIFDFIGMTESISELREKFEQEESSSNPPPPPPLPPQPSTRKPTGTIQDSQASESDQPLSQAPSSSLSSPLSSPPSSLPGHAPPFPGPVADTSSRPDPDPLPSETGAGKPQGLLVIDSLSQITAPLLKTHYAKAQAQLSVFFRSLAELTGSRGLCTVVVGRAVAGSSAPEKMRRRAMGAAGAVRAGEMRPMLGDGLGYWVDTHVYLHSVLEDSRGWGRGQGQGQGGEKGTRGKMRSGLEVVQDRYGGREGRWGEFGWGEGDGRLESG